MPRLVKLFKFDFSQVLKIIERQFEDLILACEKFLEVQ